MAKTGAGPGGGPSLPSGGGALQGIGETFSPDLHTGTANFTIPITLPPGRNGLAPSLSLSYSSGHGNGPFGLGWVTNTSGVTRKVSAGVPRFDDAADTFLLSGLEDLVMVPSGEPGVTLYRPRTEGLFARITHHHSVADDYWQVQTKDGLVSLYGTPGASGADPAVVADPDERTHILAWKLISTVDTFGNQIAYSYERDASRVDGPHHWDQVYLTQIRYVDYATPSAPRFLVNVSFIYEDRPDPFSEYRAGFEIRTLRRCARIQVSTHADQDRLTRTIHLDYADTLEAPPGQVPPNGLSLLSRIRVEGHDGAVSEWLPPVTFDYTRFDPEARTFLPLAGADLPFGSLSRPDYALVDIFGRGLPDILEMNSTVRYWRNLGDGQFDLPHAMSSAPAGVALADPGVQMVDANGDGQMDLLVTTDAVSGYYPLRFGGAWDTFHRYPVAPSFNLEDPEVRMVDLDGDGVTDAIRSGTRLECFFNDPERGWGETRFVERGPLDDFPNVNFSDPRVHWADMTGDGLQDVLLVYDGSVEYWPSLGRGRWAPRISMRNSPHFPYGYDPRRILLGDVDGDGVADLVFVGDRSVTLWINQSGNAWSDPVTIQGTPPLTDLDGVQLTDLLGQGIAGVLWSAETVTLARSRMFFLDFTGGVKPYLLEEMDNHHGAITRVTYAPSTRFALQDGRRRGMGWQTPLPVPVQVVARVESVDIFSGGKLATEYQYHHGYWDGADREFRGFGRVDRRDTQTFEAYHATGVDPSNPFTAVDEATFSPPTETRTWFHQGAVGGELGDWTQTDFSAEFWPDDPQLLTRPVTMQAWLKQLPRRVRRDALRALRGRVLRTELYALDGTERAARPYTITESLHGVAGLPLAGVWPDEPADWQLKVFVGHALAQRVTHWERGDDPLTQVTFTDDYDDLGQARQAVNVALPRRSERRHSVTGAVVGAIAPDETRVLATLAQTAYALPDPGVGIYDRAAQTWTYELNLPPGVVETTPHDVQAVLHDQLQTALQVRERLGNPLERHLVAHILHHYDGPAFVGRPIGQVGLLGALTRSEALMFTDVELNSAYGPLQPAYLGGAEPHPAGAPASFAIDLGYRHETASPYVDGYYVDTLQREYGPRGLITATRDPVGHTTTATFDAFQFLPVVVTNALGLQTRATYTYRVLQVDTAADVNDNETHFEYSPLGLLMATWVRGKPGGGEGDQTQPSVRMEYDFLAYQASEHLPSAQRAPIFVRTVRRCHHDTETDVSPDQQAQTIESREYSDGFGRLLQKRGQAEDVLFGDGSFGGGVLPADQTDPATLQAVVGRQATPAAAPNVIVSGWQVYDNKGQVVGKYQPFFDTGWAFRPAAAAQTGQKVALFYDPRGHLVRTLLPDGSEQRSVFGTPGDLADPDRFSPTPWEAFAYDANDLAPLSRDPLTGTALGGRAPTAHHFTPSSIVTDALGRTLVTVARNGPTPALDWYVTRMAYDTSGNLLTVTDAQGRLAFRHTYDLTSRRLRTESVDAGLRLVINDACNNVVEHRDGRGALALHVYDALNRPTELWARNQDGEVLSLRERLFYGDQLANQADARDRNLRGQVQRHQDEAGQMEMVRYDFKANLLEKVRQVISDATILATTDFRADWSAGMPLDVREYRTSMGFDALNRMKALTYPHDTDGGRRVLAPQYNRAGVMEAATLDGAVYLERIAYDAAGRRTLVAYGNQVMTRYSYDPRTLRLTRYRTERYTAPGPLTYIPAGLLVQDVAHETDLAGNVTATHDRAPGSGLSADPDRLDRQFGYDPLYRLLQATGRECSASVTLPWDPLPRCEDVTQTRPYTQTFTYAGVGSLEAIQHAAASGSFTRTLTYAAGTNQLTALAIAGFTTAYVQDANGNTVQEGASRLFSWDFTDRLVAYRTQAGAAAPSVEARYLYDGAGLRVKKVVRKQGGQVETTVCIDGLFEHHVTAGTANTTLHVMDNQRRIALVRVGPAFPDDGAPDMPVQYHLADHLGSSSVVLGGLDATANNFVNREEYTPYGETSFGSYARKRYRFSGKERDEESGLTYFGMRYYAPWLGGWMSCDPLGMVNGPNLYQYVNGNPLRMIDPLGAQSAEAQDGGVKEDQVPGGAAPGPEGGKMVEYHADANRIEAQEQFVHNAGAAVVNSAVDKIGPKAVLHHVKQAVANQIPIAGPLLADLLFNPLEKKIEPYHDRLKIAPIDSPAGGLGTFVALWGFEAAQIFVPGAVGKLAAGLEASKVAAAAEESQVATVEPVLAAAPKPTLTPPSLIAEAGEGTRAIGIKPPGRGRSVVPGTEQLNLNLEQRTVFSGHGEWDKANGFMRVPPGSSLTVYSKKGEPIADRLGQAIEINVDLNGVYSKTYKPGMLVPNLTLQPLPSYRVMGNPITRPQPTLLQDLLKPNMGPCYWAACFVIK